MNLGLLSLTKHPLSPLVSVGPRPMAVGMAWTQPFRSFFLFPSLFSFAPLTLWHTEWLPNSGSTCKNVCLLVGVRFLMVPGGSELTPHHRIAQNIPCLLTVFSGWPIPGFYSKTLGHLSQLGKGFGDHYQEAGLASPLSKAVMTLAEQSKVKDTGRK